MLHVIFIKSMTLKVLNLKDLSLVKGIKCTIRYFQMLQLEKNWRDKNHIIQLSLSTRSEMRMVRLLLLARLKSRLHISNMLEKIQMLILFCKVEIFMVISQDLLYWVLFMIANARTFAILLLTQIFMVQIQDL